MYGQTENQDKQKKKIIIVSLIMGIIIIVLIGVLISAITSKNKAKLADGNNQESSVIREDEKKEPEKVAENTKSEEKAEDTKLDPVSNKTEDKSATVTPSSESKNLPQTGPASLLGLALVAGSATTYAFSKRKF